MKKLEKSDVVAFLGITNLGVGTIMCIYVPHLPSLVGILGVSIGLVCFTMGGIGIPMSYMIQCDIRNKDGLPDL